MSLVLFSRVEWNVLYETEVVRYVELQRLCHRNGMDFVAEFRFYVV